MDHRTVIALAQLTITDPIAYGRYQDRFTEVFEQFDGELWQLTRTLVSSREHTRTTRPWF